jgi:hypothetical protein
MHSNSAVFRSSQREGQSRSSTAWVYLVGTKWTEHSSISVTYRVNILLYWMRVSRESLKKEDLSCLRSFSDRTVPLLPIIRDVMMAVGLCKQRPIPLLVPVESIAPSLHVEHLQAVR